MDRLITEVAEELQKLWKQHLALIILLFPSPVENNETSLWRRSVTIDALTLNCPW